MRSSVRRGVVAIAIATLLIGTVVTLAVENSKTPSTEPANPAKSDNEHVTYLGVNVESMYPPMASHMPELLGGGQGVLVASVISGSPAEKAGILPHDVLMTYGDQKLFSPEQVAKLVRADKPGRQVVLSIVREGKVEQLTATLGEHKAEKGNPAESSQPNHPWLGWQFPDWQSHLWHMPQWFTQPTTPDEKNSHWQSFDSMTIKKLSDDRFSAEIKYLDKEGKIKRQEFEGTRDEIHKAITAQKDLPQSEREQLLRSLDMPGNGSGLAGMHLIPGYGFGWDLGGSDRSL